MNSMQWDLAGRRAIVTGGAGFIGSHLARALVERGASVVVADNLQSGSIENLDGLSDRFTLVRTNLESEAVAEIMADSEVLFHCAASAYVPPSVEEPEVDFEINLHLPLRLLDWFRVNSPSTRIVLFSSGAVYGNPRHLPVDENHPIDPISPYGVSKLAAERYGAVYAQLYSMHITSLRLFAVYGPRQRKQVIYDLMKQMRMGGGTLTVLGDGRQVRDFCFVEDVVRAALTVAALAPMRGEAWNVGSGRGVTIEKLVGLIGRALGLSADPTYTGAIRPGDPEAVVADCTRLRELGWSPNVTLEEGLSCTASWLERSEPSRA